MPPASASTALETERLILRDQRISDAAVFHQLWTERDERVPPHRQIDAHGYPTAEDIAAEIRKPPEHSRPGLLGIEQKATGDVIGYCGLVFHGNGVSDEPELAFELLRDVHNRGYATEAGRAVVLWAEECGFRRLWATVWDWNLPSRRVLEKLGFHDTGRDGAVTVHGRSLLTMRAGHEIRGSGTVETPDSPIQAVLQTPSSLPLGSRKWNRRPPGKS